jgi:hypothetical protein
MQPCNIIQEKEAIELSFFAIAFFVMPIMFMVLIIVTVKKGVKLAVQVGLVFLVVLVGATYLTDDHSNVNTNTGPAHYEGQNAILDNGLSSVMAATRENSYDALYNTVSEGNVQGLQSLVASGEVMPIDKGTKVLILEKTFTTGTKVRVLEGPNNGLDVWVPADWIK